MSRLFSIGWLLVPGVAAAAPNFFVERIVPWCAQGLVPEVYVGVMNDGDTGGFVDVDVFVGRGAPPSMGETSTRYRSVWNPGRRVGCRPRFTVREAADQALSLERAARHVRLGPGVRRVGQPGRSAGRLPRLYPDPGLSHGVGSWARTRSVRSGNQPVRSRSSSVRQSSTVYGSPGRPTGRHRGSPARPR